MSLSTLLVMIVIFLVIVILVLFPEARALLKGFTRLFIKDLATTPEGAESIYSEKIDKATESYNRASDSYARAEGKLGCAKRDLDALKIRLSKVEKDCEALVKANRIAQAQLKAEEREEILSDIGRCQSKITVYTDAAQAAKEAFELCEKNLRKLKRESKEVVENMKVKKELKEVYDSMDELKATTGADKMIDAIREKNKDLDSMVDGAKIVYNNKTSTKIDKAEKEARSLQSDEYIENLKKKYSK